MKFSRASIGVIGFALFLSARVALADTSGPNTPVSAVNDSSTGAGTISWSTITSPFTIDGTSSASVSLASTRTTKYLKFTDFGFSIPANATIDGISVTLTRRTTVVDVVRDAVVALVGDSATTTSKADTSIFWPIAFTSKSYGGSADTWGRSWTASEINSASFGVIVSAENADAASSRTVHIDGVTVTVTYTVPVSDTTPPVIAARADITGVEAISSAGAVVTYTAPDATDNVDATAPASCTPASGGTFALGTTQVTCIKTDAAGNAATSTAFAVTVTDTTAPTIVLNGSSPQTILIGGAYTETGATVTDAADPAPVLTIDGSAVNTGALGTYAVTYNAVDASGNHAAQVTRAVTVVDQEAPIITLRGANPQVLTVGEPYTELGADVADNHDAGLSATIDATTVATGIAGTYTVTYDATDSSGNTATRATRTVQVVHDTTPEPFTFVDQNGVASASEIESNSIAVRGITTAVPVSVIGGEYAVGGGAYTSVTGTVSNGDAVTVRHASGSTNNAAVETVLTIGGVSDTFTSITSAGGASGGGGGTANTFSDVSSPEMLPPPVAEPVPSEEETLGATVPPPVDPHIQAEITLRHKQILDLMRQWVLLIQEQIRVRGQF
ncbi:DUF5011 domain-containing protein [Candidatus Kaiserbacteria bacterium]|nr:DUF5011 domain-containing protein [Candidatus Kaiserbacteria bacterium]